MIEIRDLTKRYGGRVVLSIRELSLKPGRYVLRGPNGSGKTTLLRILAGLIKPSSGEVRVLGGDPYGEMRIKRLIAYVGHRTGLVEDLNGRENATLLLCGLLGCERLGPFMDMARRLNLEHILGRPVRTYSKGERTKLSVAIALASGREVLLLDEPFAPLDVPSRETLGDMLGTWEGKFVIITAHGEVPDIGGRTIELGRNPHRPYN
ncbi:MAG: ABC transporter ATP-binding protein [Thermotogae bacterium]|nr:ABC transporter ATP-binding protein [Thermotogota bacterium]